MNLFEVYASAPLQLAGILGGLIGAVAAVWLAQTIPGEMELEEKPRPTWWWIGAIIVGGVYGWLLANALDSWALLPAFLVFAAATLGLALIDLDHHLIPNRVLFPSTGAVSALFVVGALGAGQGGDLLRAVIAAFAYFGFLLIVAVVARGGFGMGDVKLAFLLGLATGFRSWSAFAVSVVLAIMLGGVASIFLLLFGKKGRKAKFAYGPYLVLGAWVAIVWGQRIADWYLGSAS